MKKLLFVLIINLCTLPALASVPVSVLQFKNKVGDMSCNQDWYWWHDHLGTAFQEMLITELASDSRLELLERETIRDIYDGEVNLINSENSTHQIEKGQFTKAKYTIVGSVSEYEYCAEKSKVGVGVTQVLGLLGASGAAYEAMGSSDISFSNANAKVVVDVRLIDTRSGKIVKSVKAEGFAKRNKFKLTGDLINFEDAKNTPAGEAARNAIQKAAQELKTAMK